MTEFIHALTDPDTVFLRYAFLTGLIASIAFGIVGSYVVVKKISYIAGAIAHSVLGGIGISIFLQTKYNITWATPTVGALIAALLSAFIIGLVTIYADQREDTVIGAIWAVGMAIGILFIAKTPGYFNAMSYLFGNILFISQKDFWVVCALDILILLIVILFYHKFLAICFDSTFSELRGIKVNCYYLLLLCIIALTVVLLISIVGIVMVIALLTLPAAIAGEFSKRLWEMMLTAIILSMLFSASGLIISYRLELPTGAVIIMIAGITYFILVSGINIIRHRLIKHKEKEKNVNKYIEEKVS